MSVAASRPAPPQERLRQAGTYWLHRGKRPPSSHVRHGELEKTQVRQLWHQGGLWPPLTPQPHFPGTSVYQATRVQVPKGQGHLQQR